MRKYQTVWGPFEANFVTRKYMYVTYDLNFGVTRPKELSWAFPLLQLISN